MKAPGIKTCLFLLLADVYPIFWVDAQRAAKKGTIRINENPARRAIAMNDE
jgi:hypothetical protein